MPVEANELCILLFYSLQLKSDIWRLRNQMKFVKILGANLFAIVVLIVLIFTIISLVLNSYTRHGESLTVPDIKGIHIKDAITILEQKKLRYEVIDSLYFDDKPKLSILEQNPQPQSKVKEGRIIYLTINSDAA
ncbi:MAG: PASTA domain-containing protein, partial [Flavobacteriia bacterium]|nr:PASTA domain-containing protein [Flavobacteriia bacterium]